jgi:hypothetical protein
MLPPGDCEQIDESDLARINDHFRKGRNAVSLWSWRAENVPAEALTLCYSAEQVSSAGGFLSESRPYFGGDYAAIPPYPGLAERALAAAPRIVYRSPPQPMPVEFAQKNNSCDKICRRNRHHTVTHSYSNGFPQVLVTPISIF